VLPAFIDQLLSADDAARLELVEREGELRNRDVLIGIADAVNSIAREDLPRAERLAEIGIWLADLSDDFFGRARIRRSFGNLQVLRGKHAEALQTFDSCIEQFFLINAEVEVAASFSFEVYRPEVRSFRLSHSALTHSDRPLVLRQKTLSGPLP